jgi:hypothetical protein
MIICPGTRLEDITVRKRCAVCPAGFEAKRPSAKYCSERCRKRAQRQPGGVAATIPAVPAGASGGLEAATLAELGMARRAGSAAGLAALALARRIDASDAETGAGLASLVREHRAALADAVKGGRAEVNPLDELRSRRERKFASG